MIAERGAFPHPALDQALLVRGQRMMRLDGRHHVIIVSGEETRADKRMCRRPPAARYAIAA